MKKIGVLALITLLSTNAFALRCKGAIIDEGDYVNKVFEKCGIPNGMIRDESINGDRVVYLYKRNGVTVVISTRDGVVRDISQRRF